MYSIEAENLVKIYDKTSFKSKVKNILLRRNRVERVVALKNVSFKVRRGEIFGFLGPNGAGKTTTVKILTTILIPDEGYARVMGYDVVKESLEVRKNIGVLPEDSFRGFYRRLSPIDNLYFYASAYLLSNPMERVKEVLKIVELEEDSWNKWFQRLSQGMKQKVALARALLPDPPVLFLDEPTKGLDILFTKRFREMVRKHFGDRDRTIFLSTHDMKLVEETCDRVAIINKGKIVTIKSVDELKTLIPGNSNHIFTLKVNACSKNLFEDFVRNVKKMDDIDIVNKNRFVIDFSVKTGDIDTANKVLELALKHRLKIVLFNRRGMDIEEIIAKIIKGEMNED